MSIDFGILKLDEWLPRPPGRLAQMLAETYEAGEDGIIVLYMDQQHFKDPDTGAPDYAAYAAHWVNEYVLLQSEDGHAVSDEERALVADFFGKMTDWMKRHDMNMARLWMWY